MRWCLETAFQRYVRNRRIRGLQKGKTLFKTGVMQDLREARSGFGQPTAKACFAHSKMSGDFGRSPLVAEISFDQTPHLTPGLFLFLLWKLYTLLPKPDQGFEKSMLPD